MIARNHRHSSINPRRPGLISVVVLIALIVVALVCAAMLRVVLARRSEVATEERRVQALWLAESGLDRASSRLAGSTDYAGESWEVSAADLGGRGAGLVVIEVEPVADRADRRKVTVRADFPKDSGHRARRSLAVVLPVTPKPR